jgi:hypothetical protein
MRRGTLNKKKDAEALAIKLGLQSPVEKGAVAKKNKGFCHRRWLYVCDVFSKTVLILHSQLMVLIFVKPCLMEILVKNYQSKMNYSNSFAFKLYIRKKTRTI